MFIIYVIKNDDVVYITIKPTEIEAKKAQFLYISNHLNKIIGTTRSEKIIAMEDDPEYSLVDLGEDDRLYGLFRTELIRTPGILWGNHKTTECTEDFRVGYREYLSAEEIRKANLKAIEAKGNELKNKKTNKTEIHVTPENKN